MTPAEKMGLKVGDKVRVTGSTGSHFTVGEEIVLVSDDGTDMPYFRNGTKYQWVNLPAVEPVRNTSTTVTGPTTITVAAGETITFEGNATVKQDWVPKFGDRVVFVDPPLGMVGDFGVVTAYDSCSGECKVHYNDGDGCDYNRCSASEIKPYEVA